MELFRLFGIVDIQGNMALQQLRDINQQATKTGSTLGAIVKQAAGVAAGFGLWQGFTATAKALSNAFYGLHSQFQSAGMALETMLGSSERAKAMLADLEDFAARTPFEFPELMDATQRMLALGFSADEVIPTLQAVGDAAAGLGKGTEGINRIILALGQMQMKGKVTGEEARQLAEAGIPVWQILADAMGKSTAEVQKLSEKGLIQADKAVRALVAGMEAKFPGMMDKLADQAQGAASTIRDNLKMIFKDLTQGAFESLTTTLRGVRDWTNQLRDAFKAGGARGLYEFLVPRDVRSSLDPLLASVRSTWDSVAQSAKKAGPVLADIGKTAVSVLAPVGQAMLGIARAAAQFAGVIADNWPKIKPIVVSIGGAFLTFGVAKTVLSQAKTALDAFKAGMEGVKGATGIVSRLGAAFMDLRKAPNILSGIGAGFKTLFGASPMVLAVSAAVAGLALLAYELYKNWKDVPPFFKALWETVKGTFGLAWSAIAVVLREMQLGVAKYLNFTLGNVVRFAADVAKIIEKLPGVGQLVTGIRQAIEGAGAWFSDFEKSSAQALDEAKAAVGEAARNLGAAWEDLRTTGSTLGQAIATDLKGIFTAAKEQAKTAFGSLIPGLNKTTEAANKAGQAGEDFGNDWEAGGEKAEKAVEQVGSAIERLVSTAGSTLGEGTDKALLQFQGTLALAQNAVKALGQTEAGKTLAAELSSAAELAEQAIKGRSEEAALALMRHLSNAAVIASRSIKDETGEAAISMKNALNEAIQEIQDRFKALAEETKKTQIESIDKLHDLVVSALKKRYEQEKEVRTKAIRDSIDAEKARVDVILREIDRERQAVEEATKDRLRLKIRGIWDEIDALDELTRKEDEEAQRAEDQRRILELQAKIAEETDPIERQKLQMELAKEQQEQERRRLLAEREERKAALMKQLDDIKYQQEQALRSFEDKKQKELDYLENVYYPRILEEARVNAEAEKIILTNKHAEILELLKKYGDGWKDLGITFGKRLIEGIGPYIDELNRMVSSALTAAGAAPKTTAKTSGGKYEKEVESVGKSDLDKLRENSREWWELQNNPAIDPETRKREQERLHEENVKIQNKYEIPAEASKTEINWAKMHSGGIVKSNPLAEFLRNAMLLKPQEVPVVLQEGEIVLPRSFRLPDMSFKAPAPAVAFAGAPSITVNLNNCTFRDGTDAGVNAARGIASELRRLGIWKT